MIQWSMHLTPLFVRWKLRSFLGTQTKVMSKFLDGVAKISPNRIDNLVRFDGYSYLNDIGIMDN